MAMVAGGQRCAADEDLLILQSLWAMERRHPDGYERTLEENIAMIVEGGFDGISAHCYDPDRVRTIGDAIRGTGLAVEGMCFPKSVEDLKPALDCAAQYGVLHLNIQPDVRLRRIEECVPLIEGWMRLGAGRSSSLF